MERLAGAIGQLAHAILDVGQHPRSCQQITKADLDNLEQRLSMKLSAIKTQVATAAANTTEALDEIVTKLNQLILDAQDPDVTDEAFLANLTTVTSKAEALANVANPDVTTDVGAGTEA